MVLQKENKRGSSQLSEILQEMNEAGGFSIAVLTDRHGFPLASAAGQGNDPDTQSAVVALIQKTAAQATSQLGIGQTDEITLFDSEGNRLVCRPFDVNGHQLILAVRIDDRHKAYRRLTNQAIRKISQAWRL
ncbi:MAG TPA: roadblock/LC7 domain-containing protein [Chloroflexi bacterium]|nr:roadblock/LC7 domain-containing protein [Chloroflexota bacterium]